MLATNRQMFLIFSSFFFCDEPFHDTRIFFHSISPSPCAVDIRMLLNKCRSLSIFLSSLQTLLVFTSPSRIFYIYSLSSRTSDEPRKALTFIRESKFRHGPASILDYCACIGIWRGRRGTDPHSCLSPDAACILRGKPHSHSSHGMWSVRRTSNAGNPQGESASEIGERQ